MKPSLVYKKRFNSTVSCILLVLVFYVIPAFFSFADTEQEIRNKINQKDADIEKLEAEIKTYQGQLVTLGQQKNSLAGAIKELDVTKKKLETDIALTGKKIDKTNLVIQSLSSDIGTKEEIIATHKESITIELQKTDEIERTSILETIFSENDFTVIWNDIDNILSLREKMLEEITQLKEVKTELEDTRKVSIGAKNELVALKKKLSDQQKIVIENTNEKNKLLQQTKNNETNYQKLLQDRIAKRDIFEKELQDFEAQLQFILDPSKLPGKGVLSWPLSNIFVTSPYGPRARGFHRGVDFRASVGTSVMSMADGVVKGVGDTDACCPGASFGKWIFIEYNNGLSSTYGHLSLIKVTKGQKVSRGQIVGYSGNTGSSTGPHLHVSLYVSSGVKVDSFNSKSYPGKILTQPISATNAHLEPMYYLPPYKI